MDYSHKTIDKYILAVQYNSSNETAANDFVGKGYLIDSSIVYPGITEVAGTKSVWVGNSNWQVVQDGDYIIKNQYGLTIMSREGFESEFEVV